MSPAELKYHLFYVDANRELKHLELGDRDVLYNRIVSENLTGYYVVYGYTHDDFSLFGHDWEKLRRLAGSKANGGQEMEEEGAPDS